MEDNKDISQIILDKIKEEGIKPISKKVFDLQKFLFWFLVSLSIAIGSVSFSVVLLLLINNEWVLFNKLGLIYIFESLPYFWLICLLLFAALGKYYYRKTLLGHRRNIMMVVGLYAIITMLFGSIIYAVGIGNIIERSLYNNVSIYRGVTFDREKLWNLNDDGLLSGIVTNFDNNILKLRDSNGLIWNIDISEASLGRGVNIVKCAKLRIVGDEVSRGIFKADIVNVWVDRGTGQIMEENCLMNN
jgi:hypothetical protein